MPKVIIEFNLPEEAEELQYAQNGATYSIILYELDMYLRGLHKHEDTDLIDIIAVRQKISELCEEYGVNKP